MNVNIQLSISDYERTLQTQFIPPAVVATRANSASDWCEREERDLVHSQWKLENPRSIKKLIGNNVTINFDPAVAYGGVRLTDLRHDRLAKKIFCLNLLKKGNDPNGVSKACEYFDWYTRHRLCRGIENNRDHDEETLRQYRLDISKGDLIGLLPYENWLDQLVEQVNKGTISLVTTREKFDWGKLGEHFGVTKAVLVRSFDFRLHLAERVHLLTDGLIKSSDVVLPLKQRAEAAGISTTTALHLLRPLEWAYEGAQNGEAWFNPILVHPFKNMTRSSCAINIAKEGGRTPTLIPEDFIRILDLAAKWILDYSSYILTAFRMLSTEMGLRKSKTRKALKHELEQQLDSIRPEGAPLINLSWRAIAPAEGRLLAATAIKHLISACIILIGGFAARRIGEITNLLAGCLSGSGNAMFLSTYIEKTGRHYDNVPVPGLFKHPIEILEELSSKSRSKSGEHWLFEITAPAGLEKETLCTRYGLRLDEFVDFNKLAPPKGRTSWDISSHQLRRGFGIIYFNGFILRSYDALSRFYRHDDPEMTRIYINHVLPGMMSELREELRARQERFRLTAEDEAFIKLAKAQLAELKDRADVWRDSQSNAIASRLISMWDGAERPFGHGGRTLRAFVAKLDANVQVQIRNGARSNSPDKDRQAFVEAVKDAAYRLFMEPVPGVGVHCLCDPNNADHIAVATCELMRIAHEASTVVPQLPFSLQRDFAFTNTYVCLECVHAACFREDEQILDAKEENLRKAADGALSPASKNFARDKLTEYKARVAAARNIV